VLPLPNFRKITGLVFALFLVLALFSSSEAAPLLYLNNSMGHSIPSAGEKLALAGFSPPAMDTLDVQGNYAYVGAGASLLVIDVSNPDDPRRVAYRLLPAEALKVVATTGRVYLLTSAGQVQIFDIFQPAFPSLIGSYSSTQNPTYLDADGERFYLNGDDGFSILDASDPGSAVLLGTLPVTATYNFPVFKVSGNRAVIVMNNFMVGAQIFVADLSDPTHPTIVGQGLDFTSHLGFTNLVVSGNLAALAVVFANLYDSPGVLLIDLTDPAHPALTNMINWYPFNNYDAVALQDHYLYSSSLNEGVTIYDISDPISPLKLGSTPTKTKNFAVIGNRIYIAAGGDGFAIYDVDASGNPTPRGVLPAIGLPRDVAVKGANLFVADGGVPQYLYDTNFGGLSILSVEQLNEFKIIGKVKLSSPGNNIALEGDRAYLTWGNCNNDRYGTCPRGISTFNISNPDYVYTLQSYDLPVPYSPLPGPVAVRNQIAYIANTAKGLSILDFGNPAPPTLLGSYPESATGVAITGTYALVSSQTYQGASRPSLQVVDISNPMTPTALTEYDMSGPHQITLAGSLAFLADGDAGLKVLDISHLPQVTVLGTLDTPGTALDVAYDGRYAYLADGEGGLRMIDVSDPSNPVEVDAFDTAGRAANVATDGDQIYLADETGGLLVFSVVKPQGYLPLLLHY
jgi:hypothetical protein